MMTTKRNFFSRSNLARVSSCTQKIPLKSVLNTNPLIFLLLILEIWNSVSWEGIRPELFLQTCILHHVKPVGVDWARPGGQCPPQHPSQDQGSWGGWCVEGVVEARRGALGQPWASDTSTKTGAGQGHAISLKVGQDHTW